MNPMQEYRLHSLRHTHKYKFIKWTNQSTMRTDLIAYVLASDNRRAVVMALLDRPSRLWGCSAVEDLTGLSHATVFRTLRGLRDFGLLRSSRPNRKDIVYELAQGLREYLDIIGGTSISLADDEPADGIVDTVRIAAYVEVPGGMYSLSREWSTRLWDAPDAMYHDTIRLPGGTGQQLDLWADELMEKYRAQFDIERICIDEWAR